MPKDDEQSPADTASHQFDGAGPISTTYDEKKGTLTIVLGMIKPARPSGSGKTLVCVSTGGAKTTSAKLEGMPITVNVTAYIKPAEAGKR